MVCHCVWSRNLKHEVALARTGLLHQIKKTVYHQLCSNLLLVGGELLHPMKPLIMHYSAVFQYFLLPSFKFFLSIMFSVCVLSSEWKPSFLPIQKNIYWFFGLIIFSTSRQSIVYIALTYQNTRCPPTDDSVVLTVRTSTLLPKFNKTMKL